MLLLLLPLLLTLASAQTQCPKCGPTEVPYPLSTAPGCGLPGYALSCNPATGTLHFISSGNFSYRVLTISAAASRLTIQPPPIAPDTCLSADLGLGGLAIDDASPFNISKANTVMLFNCSETILLSPLNCSATSPCRLFEEERAAAGCRNTLCCSYLKDASMTSRRIRVRAGGCSAYTSVVDFRAEESVEEWRFGIELQWLPPPNGHCYLWLGFGSGDPCTVTAVA